MLKLLSASQMREADAHTIASKPIASIHLMENASQAFVDLFKEEFPDRTAKISVYCGTGNNGGDGLAIARLLSSQGYENVEVKIARFSGKSTTDFESNFSRLKQSGLSIKEFSQASDAGEEEAGIIIDALLGSGLNKPLSGEWEKLVNWMNGLGKTIVSVDIPTGFKSEGTVDANDIAIHSDLTITFQRPKISFLLPEAADFVQYFEVADIGLDEGFIQNAESPYLMLTGQDVTSRLKARLPFSHKGTFGHALLIAGAAETMGAALLSAEACVYAGAGLTSACIPAEGLTALNTSVPEVMAVIREKDHSLPGVKWDKYQSVAVGPGLGTGEHSLRMLKETLRNFRKPVVIDADALNLIAANYEIMQLVPEFSIFTPHVKEFDRLFGEHKNWWERLGSGIDRAVTLGCTIILKNRYTIIFTSDGKCLFNPTGSPAMASGGMGDVLTGIIASFLAQGYSPSDAAILGVYLHGAAGESLNGYVVPPSRLIEALPETILKYLS